MLQGARVNSDWMRWLSVHLSTGTGRQEAMRKEGVGLCCLLYGACDQHVMVHVGEDK